MTESVQVEHDSESHSFKVEMDGLVAQLECRLRDQTLTLVHSDVPEGLRGRGIAGSLVEAAVEFASDEGLVVAPACEYASKWLDKHHDVAAKVVIDWSVSKPRDGASVGGT